jgi:hypothetical protein
LYKFFFEGLDGQIKGKVKRLFHGFGLLHTEGEVREEIVAFFEFLLLKKGLLFEQVFVF